MAYVDRFVTVDAPGTGGGTSFADSWDLAQAFASVTQSKRVLIRHHSLNRAGGASGAASYLQGTHASPAWAGNLTCNALDTCFLGLNTSDAYAVTPADRPVIDFNGTGTGAFVLTSSGGLAFCCRITNCGGIGIFLGVSQTGAYLSTVDNCDGNGIEGTTETAAVGCDVHDNGGNGILVGANRCLVASNRIYDNTTIQLALGGTTSNIALGNYIDGGGITTGIHSNNEYGYILNNTINDCSLGITLPGKRIGVLLGNLISNCTTGLNGAGTNHVILNSNNWYYNNGTDIDGLENNPIDLNNSLAAADPEYENIATGLYAVSNADLIAAVIEGFDIYNELNIGAWQGAGGGGGAAAARAGIFGPAGALNHYWPNIGG